MSRIDSLHCPFASKVHVDASQAHEVSVRWAQSMGMLPTEQHVRGALNAKVGWLVARGFPTATRDGLQLVADWTVLFCLLDDRIEKLSAREVEAYLGQLLAALRNDAATTTDAFELGIVDVRRRLTRLASAPATALAHFTSEVEVLFAGFTREARDREHGEVPDIASYLKLREITVGLKVILTLVDAIEGICLPDYVLSHPMIRRLATRTSNIVGWSNDLFTYEKEIIQGEIHNLVLAVMTERSMALADAVATTIELHDSEVCLFIEDVERLPSFGDDDGDVQRYVEMLRCWIRGHLDWAFETGRYQPSGVASAAQRRMVVGDDEFEFAALSDEPWPRGPQLCAAASPVVIAPRTWGSERPIERLRARGTEDVRLLPRLVAEAERDRDRAKPEHRSESRELPRLREPQLEYES